jgi:hypothetical protein
VLSGLLLSLCLHAEIPVEVVLVNKLDEPRGYCLDVPGFMAEAKPEKGLQIHTCYSYRGPLAVDQAFDSDKISAGTFQIIQFDLCMTAQGHSEEGKLSLAPCDGGDNQQFKHESDGQIESLAVRGNCLTAGKGPSNKGGGGNPVHLYRDLTLEDCKSSIDDRQRWRLRETAD